MTFADYVQSYMLLLSRTDNFIEIITLIIIDISKEINTEEVWPGISKVRSKPSVS